MTCQVDPVNQAAQPRQRTEAKFRVVEKQPSPAQLSSENTPPGLRALQAHQITLELQNEALRRTQGELEVLRARYFSLYNLTPVGYVTLSEQGLILEANLTTTDLLNVVKSDLIKQSLMRFILPEDQEVFCRHRKALFGTGTPQTYELRLVGANSPPFWARLEMTVTQEVDGASVCRVVINNIAERVRAEQARQQAEAAEHASEARYRALAEENARLLAQSQQAAETQTLLLQEVNHRTKNNLAALLGLLQWELRCLETGQPTPYRSLVNDLTGRIQSLAQVHNLLSANRGAPLSLEQLAENVMRIAPALLTRQQPAQLEISPTSVHLAPAQASAVGLILNELVTNSLKHVPQLGAPICLYLQTHLSEDEVNLEYRDDGPGYPEEILPGKRESGGLYLIEALAEHDLGGNVTFSNGPGAVARLRFALAPNGRPVSPQAALV